MQVAKMSMGVVASRQRTEAGHCPLIFFVVVLGLDLLLLLHDWLLCRRSR